MKMIILLLGLVAGTAPVPYEAGWKVTMGKSTLLITTEENRDKNTITLSRAELDGPLMVHYNEKPEKGWKRETSVVDDAENELVKRGSRKVALSQGELKSILSKGITRFHVFSWTIPTDPQQAALVRVRRVHLCTIVVK
jgi:hypothetical protein